MSKQDSVVATGYYGERVTCNFFVSKRHKNVRRLDRFNDIAFKRAENGTFQIISETPEQVKKLLMQKYQENVIRKQANKLHLKIKKMVGTKGEVKLTLYS